MAKRLQDDAAVDRALSAFKAEFKQGGLRKSISGSGAGISLIEALKNYFTSNALNASDAEAETLRVWSSIVAQLKTELTPSGRPFSDADFTPSPAQPGWTTTAENVAKATNERGVVDQSYLAALQAMDGVGRALLAKVAYRGFGAHASGSTPLTPSVEQVGLDPSTPIRKSGKKIYTSPSDLGRDADDDA